MEKHRGGSKDLKNKQKKVEKDQNRFGTPLVGEEEKIHEANWTPLGQNPLPRKPRAKERVSAM